MRAFRRPLFLIVAFAVACSSSAPPAGAVPTIEEARVALERVVALARAGDFDGLCAMGDGNCTRHLEDAGRDAVPPDPPTVVATRIIPTSTSSEGQISLGGVVFVLCGIDGNGNHYDSEMLVFNTGHGLGIINPIYWGTVRVGDSADPVAQETVQPVTC